MNPAEYAEHVGVDLRTVRRWLGRGELPGATQGPDGRWHIPADTVRQAPLPGTVVASNGGGTSVARHVTQHVTRQDAPQGPSLSDALDRVPALLTIEQAAFYLGITEHAVNAHRAELGAVKWGTSWRIPQRTVRELAGLR